MKVVAWNVRGARCPYFVSRMRKLLKNTTLDILFLFETRINDNKNMNILPNLPFECCDFVNSMGFQVACGFFGTLVFSIWIFF